MGRIVLYVFLVGGAFGIVHKTGAFENGVNKAESFGKSQLFNDPTNDDHLFNIRFYNRFS